jgi:hypothetical protein
VNWIRLAQDRFPVVGFCEHTDELFGFMKSRNIFYRLSDYQLLKQGPALWSYLVITRQVFPLFCYSTLQVQLNLIGSFFHIPVFRFSSVPVLTLRNC